MKDSKPSFKIFGNKKWFVFQEYNSQDTVTISGDQILAYRPVSCTFGEWLEVMLPTRSIHVICSESDLTQLLEAL